MYTYMLRLSFLDKKIVSDTNNQTTSLSRVFSRWSKFVVLGTTHSEMVETTGKREDASRETSNPGIPHAPRVSIVKPQIPELPTLPESL